MVQIERTTAEVTAKITIFSLRVAFRLDLRFLSMVEKALGKNAPFVETAFLQTLPFGIVLLLSGLVIVAVHANKDRHSGVAFALVKHLVDLRHWLFFL